MPAPTGRVLCVGSCNTDLIAYMPRFPAPGETLFGSSFGSGFGGKGANQLVMAAKLAQGTGEPRPAMVGALGDDGFGRDTLANFEAQGVDARWVGVHAGVASGVAPIWVDAHGSNCIVVVPGANALVSGEAVQRALGDPALADASVLLAQLEIPLPATLAALVAARARGVTTVLTPAPAPDTRECGAGGTRVPHETRFAPPIAAVAALYAPAARHLSHRPFF